LRALLAVSLLDLLEATLKNRARFGCHCPEIALREKVVSERRPITWNLATIDAAG